MDLRTLRLALATWEKGASRVNDCKAIGGSVGEKIDQGWADENGEHSASALQPSQVAGKALSTSLERQNKQAWKEHLGCCHCKIAGRRSDMLAVLLRGNE